MKIFAKFLVILSLISILIVGVGCVSASEDTSLNNVSDTLSMEADSSPIEQVEIDNPQLSSYQATFTDIQDLIDNADDGDTIELNGTYINSNEYYIQVNKSITIDGKGNALLDSNNSITFNVSSSNVKFVNLNFINLCYNKYGDAINWEGENGLIENCSFKNSEEAILNWRGLNGSLINCDFEDSEYTNNVIYWNASGAFIKSCRFKRGFTHGQYGGTIVMWGNNSRLEDCSFNDSSANRYGGAICWMGINGTILNSTFENCYARLGGAITIGHVNTSVSDCVFINCSSSGYGGAVYWAGGYGNLTNCEFSNCSSSGYGGAVAWCSIDGYLGNCSFIDCNANGPGGAVYWESINGCIENSIFSNATSKGSTGAIYWTGKYGILRNSTFIDCKASYDILGAGAVFWWGNNALIDECEFINCSVNLAGGAITIFGDDGLIVDCDFVDCSAVSAGAINSYSESITVLNTTFKNCSAESGGAIHGGSMNVINCSFIDLTADYGAAIYINGPLNITGSLFENVHANEDGGAIFGYDSARILIDGTIFSNASSGNLGDIIYTKGSSLNVQYSILQPNDNIGDKFIIYAENTTIDACNNWWGDVEPSKLVNYDAYNSHDLSRWVVLDDLTLTDGEIIFNFNHLIDENGTISDFEGVLPSFTISASAVNGSFINNEELVIDNIARFTYIPGGESDILTFKYNANTWYLVIGQDSKIPTNLSVQRSYNADNSHVLLNISLYDINNNPLTDSVILSFNGKRRFVNVENGVANVEIENSDDDYLIVVKYDGMWRYLSSEKRISKESPFVSVNSSQIYYHDDLNVKVTVTDDIEGSILLKLCDKNYSSEIIHGSALFTIPNLNAGSYVSEIVYIGNLKYQGVTTYGTFKVEKINATNWGSGGFVQPYGTEMRVYFWEDVTGSLKILFNDTLYVEDNVVNGWAFFNMGDLPVGKYNATLIYDGDKNYNPFISNFTMEIKKSDTYLNIFLDHSEYGQISYREYGEVITIIVNLHYDANGEFIFKLNDISFTQEVNNGSVYEYNFTDLMPGFYNCTVFYYGDAYRNPKNHTKLFVITKHNQTVDLNISVSDINFGEDLVVNVDVNGTGNITLSIDGANYTHEVKDNFTSFVIPGLAPGDYEITVTYWGNATYNDVIKTAIVVVNNYDPSKNNVTMDVSVLDIDYGENAIINVNLDEDATGEVSIILDEITLTQNVNNGFAQFNISNLNAGNYTFKINYSGDDNYNEKRLESNFTVRKITPELELVVYDVNEDDDLRVTVYLNATGRVVVDVEEYGSGMGLIVENGVATGFFYLSAGNYTLIAEYSGDENHNAVSTTETCEVHPKNPLKYDTDIDVVLENNSYGKTAAVTAQLNENATGEISLFLNSVRYVSDLVNGQATFNVAGLDRKTYPAEFTYLGDHEFNGITKWVNINIEKAEPVFDFYVEDIEYGQNIIVNVTVSFGDVESFMVYIDDGYGGYSQYCYLEGGCGIINISYYPFPGNYTIKLVTQETNHFISSELEKTFQILKLNSTIDLNVSNINYGETLTVTFQLSNRASDYVEVSVDGAIEQIFVSDGFGSVEYYGLSAGTHNVSVSYNGDGLFNNAYANTTVKVYKITPNIYVSAYDIDYGEDLIVNVLLPSDSTRRPTVTIGNVSKPVTIRNGMGSVEFSGLTGGIHDILVSYAGDNNYNAASANATVKVRGLPEITVYADDVVYGDVLVVNVSGSVEGNYIVAVNGESKLVGVVDGFGFAEFDCLDAGSYVAVAYYDGDDDYCAASANATVTVNKATPVITVSADDIDYGEYLLVNVNSNVDGDYTIGVNDDSCVFSVYAGVGHAIFSGLGAGTYDVVVSYAGHINYNAASANATVTVNKISPIISVSADDIDYHDVLKVTINSDVDGSYAVDVNGESAVVSVVGGRAYVSFSGLGAGIYDVVASYDGDENYNAASANATVKVNKATPEITVSANAVDYGKDLTVTVKLSADAARRPTVTIGNQSKAVTMRNGVGTVKFSGLDAGTQEVVASYNGDANYGKASAETTAKVKPIPEITVSANDVGYGNDLVVTVKLSADATRRPTVTIGDESKLVTMRNGVGSVRFSGLDVGTYDIVASYSGDADYGKASATTTAKVNPIPEITVSASDIVQGEDLVVTVQLPSDATRRPTVTVGGESKLVTMRNGIGSVKFSGLTLGTYTIDVTYGGDSYYGKASVSTTVNVSRGTAEINVVANPVSYGETAVIDIQLPSDVTGPATVTIGTETQTVSLNNGAGSAEFTGLSVGTHTVTVAYEGDSKYVESSINTIVKVNKATPEIKVTADDITYGETLTVAVKFPADVTKRATVTIDGITKYVSLKNGEGTVKFTGLSQGTHEVEVAYAGDANYKKTTTTTAINVKS